MSYRLSVPHRDTSETTSVARSIGRSSRQTFSSCMLKGLEEGFRIGFHHKEAKLQSCDRNMSRDVPEVVTEYLHQELQLGRLMKLS